MDFWPYDLAAPRNLFGVDLLICESLWQSNGCVLSEKVICRYDQVDVVSILSKAARTAHLSVHLDQ